MPIKKFNHIVKFSLILIFICYALFPAQAFANKDTLVLSPIASTLNAVPGQTLAIEFSLTSKADRDYSAKLSLAEVIDEAIVEERGKFNTATWIKLETENIALKQDKAAVVSVGISVPASTKPGSYKVLVIATPDTETKNDQLGANVIGAVSYTITINVMEGAPKETVKATANIPSLNLSNSISFSYQIENTENLTISPIGYLRLFNPKGDIVYQEVVNSEQRPLDPQEQILGEKSINLSLNGVGDIGTYRLEFLALDPGFQTSDISVKTMLFIPWWLVLAGLGIIGLIVGGAALVQRRKRYTKLKSTYIES